MVGDDQDHNIWTAPEVQTQNRPTYWADASNPSVDASGHMAAALAATSLAFRDKNADYADACLKYANALEKFTEKYPKATYEGIGSYYSCGNIEDKVAWSDLWCAIANNNGKLPDSYQAQYTPSNGVYNGSIYDYWVYSWDKVWGGYSALLYSMDPQKYSAHGSELVFDMDQLVGNKNQAYYPVGGGWGASRYNCAWQMYALTYAKYTSGQDKYNEYAQGQMDYLLGNNPANRSYLIGFGDSYPQHIHHRAANPDKDTAKYILYGTLVGGPTDANGSYDDNTNSYSCTEPALDYNGCFALAIAGLYAVYGGSTTAAQGAIASASEINSDFVFSYGGETPQPGTTTTEQTTTTTEETTVETTTEETTEATTTTEETTTTIVTTTEQPDGYVIRKCDVGGNEIGGASLNITDQSGNVIDQWVSEEGVSHVFAGIQPNTPYCLTETLAPADYLVAEPIYFQLNEDGTLVLFVGVSLNEDGSWSVENAVVTANPDGRAIVMIDEYVGTETTTTETTEETTTTTEATTTTAKNTTAGNGEHTPSVSTTTTASTETTTVTGESGTGTTAGSGGSGTTTAVGGSQTTTVIRSSSGSSSSSSRSNTKISSTPKTGEALPVVIIPAGIALAAAIVAGFKRKKK